MLVSLTIQHTNKRHPQHYYNKSILQYLLKFAKKLKIPLIVISIYSVILKWGYFMLTQLLRFLLYDVVI